MNGVRPLDLSPNGRILHGFERPVGIAVSIAVAALSFHFVEQPFLRLGRRLSTRSSPHRETAKARPAR
jgi:peptidoglycan/LPS O-acetylase OafA/YrhL